MLDVWGDRYATCDGTSRRSVLQVGMLGLAGLALPDLLRHRASARDLGRPVKDTAVILVYLGGGLTHIDSYDPKPNAPQEFRGEFRSIATALPGISLCEHYPRQARVLDKMAVLRSLHHTTADHNVGQHWVLTGYPASEPLSSPATNNRPSAGSVAARLRGSNRPGLPPYVAIPHAPTFAHAAYLGPGFNPFSVAANPTQGVKVRDLEPPPSLTLERLDDRRSLLKQLDRLDRQRDASGLMAGVDHFTAEAYEMITGPAARRAFDLTREDPRLQERYGPTTVGRACLLGRRLVEAGVTFVTVAEGGWDHHGQLFTNCRRQLPALDAALATLVEDLHDRGLAEKVLVVAWGEFGRTPKVNANAGRDHWPGCMSAVVAGGGLSMGQVIGATNPKAERPVDRPLQPEDLLRTVYHVLGIDPHHEFQDDAGRPLPVLNRGQIIPELT